MQCRIVRKFGKRWRYCRPRFEQSYISISWEWNVFSGSMNTLYKRCLLYLLWGGRQIMSTWFSRAKLMTSKFVVCEHCLSGTWIRVSYLVDLVCEMKWRNHWVKISLCIRPERWHAWIDPGGVPFIGSGFIYFLGNSSNGEMKSPFGLIQLTTVTRDLRSAVWKIYIWRVPSNPNIFVCLCCTLLMRVSSQV
jgi:hypothetical protein